MAVDRLWCRGTELWRALRKAASLKHLVCLLALCAQSADGAVPVRAVTPSGVQYQYLSTVRSGPLVMVFATTASESLSGKFTGAVDALVRSGHVVASLDLPCHVEAAERVSRTRDVMAAYRSRDVQGLGCWAAAVRSTSEDVFLPFLEAVSEAISDLQARGLTTGQRVGVLGVSRGGYVALRAAVANSRIAAAAVLAPVTHLGVLKEFSNVSVGDQYDLVKLSWALAGKSLFLQIGSNDRRVGTGSALRLVDGVIAASGEASPDLTVMVTPTPGHQSSEHEKASEWLRARLSRQGGEPEVGVAPPR